MKKWLMLVIPMLMTSALVHSTELKMGSHAELKDGGWVCRTLDKAIASREIDQSKSAGDKADITQLNNGSCIMYSVRPFKIVGYDDYLIPAFPEKGKLFVTVIEPRSGEKWHAFTGFLQPVK